MDNKRIGIIAGTFVDTQMGVDFFISKGMDALGYPVSSSPEEQSMLQILSPLELSDSIREIIRTIKSEGINSIVVYCNSLSAAVDLDKLAIGEDVRIITPFSAYKTIANEYKSIGVLTANNQSSAGIEKIILSTNPECNVIGIGILQLAIEIEKGTPADLIVEQFGLKSILDFYNKMKVDVIILGCTHFPYLYDELNKYSSIPILDPAELMYELLTQ